MFTLEFRRFELKGDKFILYDSSDKESKEGFLSFTNVAAIIPEQQRTEDALCFYVYLKGKPHIEVFASTFEAEQEPSVTFRHQQKDMMRNIMNEWPIENIYIALSEVVAIIPSDGLLSWRG